VALGDSANGYGGNIRSDVHIDGIVNRVTVEIDGRAIVEDGEPRF
jgi:leucyl aminopeptidase (aminopeptidase T)